MEPPKYNKQDLKNIANCFNKLSIATKGEILSKVSIETLNNYHCKTYYIDFNEETQLFHVCLKFDGWKID